jgi:hypothetical protein
MARRNKATEADVAVENAIAIVELPPSPEELARIEQVFVWIIQGQTEYNITQAIRTQWPDVEPMPLIVKTLERLVQSSKFNPDVIRGWVFEAYRELYRNALAAQDFASAIRIIAKINEMAGSEGD